VNMIFGSSGAGDFAGGVPGGGVFYDPADGFDPFYTGAQVPSDAMPVSSSDKSSWGDVLKTGALAAITAAAGRYLGAKGSPGNRDIPGGKGNFGSSPQRILSQGGDLAKTGGLTYAGALNPYSNVILYGVLALAAVLAVVALRR
jgi:hypothetical protein